MTFVYFHRLIRTIFYIAYNARTNVRELLRYTRLTLIDRTLRKVHTFGFSANIRKSIKKSEAALENILQVVVYMFSQLYLDNRMQLHPRARNYFLATLQNRR